MILSVGGGHFLTWTIWLLKNIIYGYQILNIEKKFMEWETFQITIQTVSSTTNNIAQLYIYYGAER